MARYFVAGNLWSLMALLMILGRSIERTEPTMVSFFGSGWLYSSTYSLLVALCAIAAVVCFSLAWKTRRSAV